MLSDNQRLTTEERANLVAYLDGELDAEFAQVLATKLTHSTTARREVENLEKTWELLDFLPRPRASAELASRTLTQAHLLDDPGGRLFSSAQNLAGTVLRVTLALSIMVLSLALGYVATRWVWPDSTARLARDLSIAEHLDEYQEVQSLEFLQALDNTFTEAQ